MAPQNEERRKDQQRVINNSIALLVIVLAIAIILGYRMYSSESGNATEADYEFETVNGTPLLDWRIKNLPVRDPLQYTTLSGNDVKVRVLNTWNPKLVVDSPNLRRYEMSYKNDEYFIDNAYTYEEIKLEKMIEDPKDFQNWVTDKIVETRKPNDEVQIKQFFNLPHYIVAVVTDHTNRVAHFYISAVNHNYAYHIFYEEGHGTSEILSVMGDILTQLTGVTETQAATALTIDPFYDYLSEYFYDSTFRPMQWFEVASEGKYYITFTADEAVGVIRLMSEEYGDYSEVYVPLTGNQYEYTVLANKGDKLIFYGLSSSMQIKAQCVSGQSDQTLTLEPVDVYGFPNVKAPGYVYGVMKEDQERRDRLTRSMNSLQQEYDDVYDEVMSQDIPNAVLEEDASDTENEEPSDK